jgi:hypothetical protein
MFTKLILKLAGIVSKDVVTVPAADEAVLDFTLPCWRIACLFETFVHTLISGKVRIFLLHLRNNS